MSYTHLKKLLKKCPTNIHILFHIAQISIVLNDRHYAKVILRQVISSDPFYIDAVKLLCNLLWTEKDLQGLLDLAQQIQSESLPLVCALDLAKKQGDQTKATSIANEILNIVEQH